MRIFTVVGARPQFVKAAVVSRAIMQNNAFEEVLVHTGQHFDESMSDVFFREMEIPKPDHNLAINSLSHGAMTGRMLEGLESLMKKEKPDMVLVYGDTNSTLAGALAAKKIHIPVCHVEAGLRSFNIKMPEEVNRILTDRISDILFCPTDTAVENLQKEGYEHINCEVVKSGDVMQDAAYYYAKKSEEKSTIIKKIGNSDFILCTLHRAENTDDFERLSNIVAGLNEVNQTTKVVLPLHPRTKKYLAEYNLNLEVTTVPPVGYFDMIELLKHCKMVITDSGGLQKEAFFFSKNCVTVRDQTEWVELVDHGFNTIVGADKQKILAGVNDMMKKNNNFELNLYGNGQAGLSILSTLSSFGKQ